MVTFVPKKQRVSDTQTASVAVDLEDLVIVGRVGGAYGIKGWVKIHPFSHSPDALMHTKQWWIAPYVPSQDVADATWQLVSPQQLKPHADAWVAAFQEWGDRSHAELHKGWQIAIPRAAFPETESNEFYWVDLMGAQVINQDSQCLGEVVGLLENAAHTVMQIRGASSDFTKQKPVEYLIPFVSVFVGEVDLQSSPKTIAVIWDVEATA